MSLSTLVFSPFHSFFASQGKYMEAGKLYRHSVDIREKVLGGDHPDVALSLNEWACLLKDQVGAVAELEANYRGICLLYNLAIPWFLRTDLYPA